MDFRENYCHMYEQLAPAQSLLGEILVRARETEETQGPKKRVRGGIRVHNIEKSGRRNV